MGLSNFPIEQLPRVTLGTAQLGSGYGIANRRGCPDDSEAQAILDAAWREGSTCLDTAPTYGRAEERVGAWCRRSGHRPLLISKLPALPSGSESSLSENVRMYFDFSCRALGVPVLDGYLVHRADDLHRPGVASALRDLCADGRLRAFGVSVYSADEIDRALEVPGLSLVQAPINVFDLHVVDSGAVARCRTRGVLVFARSVLLQGVFALDPSTLPEYLSPARPALAELGRLAELARCDTTALALLAVRDIPGIASLVMGVDCVEQVVANARAARMPSLDAALREAVMELGKNIPRDICNPSRWPVRS